MKSTQRFNGRLNKVLAVCFLAVLLLTFLSCTGQEQPKKVSLTKVLKDQGRIVSQTSTKENVIRVGFDLRLSPREDIKIYTSFLKYLEKETGYDFELYFSPKYESNIEALGEGKTQFSFMGGLSYIQAHQKYDVQTLARGLNSEGKDKYKAVIFARSGSQITRLNQIRGKTFAFGSEDSTQGHLIPRQMLEDVGISLKDLKDYKYTGSHEDCVRAVIRGEFEAGGMQDTLAKALAQEGRIKIIKFSDYYPSSGFCVNPHVDPKLVAAVKKALLEFDPQDKDKAGLYHWEKTEMPKGFVKAKDSDYGELRKLARKYGML